MNSALSLVFCLAAGWLGGYPWAGIAAFATGCFLWKRSPTNKLAVTCTIALLWLVAFHFTGDRRLFFPYSMLFAASVLLIESSGLLLASLVTVLFFAIRIFQDATQSVLVVEALVTLAALAPALIAKRQPNQTIEALTGVAVLCSGIAFLGLNF